MEKFFNTAGPIQPDIHYFVNPLDRVNFEELEMLYELEREYNGYKFTIWGM